MKKSGYQREIDRAYRYWQNMTAGKYYVKGEQDSTTKKKVMASRRGNEFSPNACYFAFVDELPGGTYYVDCE